METRAGGAPAPVRHPSGSAAQGALALARDEEGDIASAFPDRVTRKRPATEDSIGGNPDYVVAGGGNVDGCDGQKAESEPSHRQRPADTSATEPGESFQTRHTGRSGDGGVIHRCENHPDVDADASGPGRPAKTPRLAGGAATAAESASAFESSKTTGAAGATASGDPGHAVDSSVEAGRPSTNAPDTAVVVTSADKGEAATRGSEETSGERPSKIARHRRGRVFRVGQDDGTPATPATVGEGAQNSGSGSTAVAGRSAGGSESACSSNGTAASQRFSDLTPICGRSRAPSGTSALAVRGHVELEDRITATRNVRRNYRPGETVNLRSTRRHPSGAHGAEGRGEYLDRKRYPDGGPRDAGKGSAGETGASHVEDSKPLERAQMGVDQANIPRHGRERGRAHGTRDASVREAGRSKEDGRARRTRSRGHRKVGRVLRQMRSTFYA